MSLLPRFRALALMALLAVPVCARAELQAGDPLPPLGSTPDKTPETRDHVVLLDFWASWCAPCKASFPAFARLHHDFAGRDLVIIAVGVDEKENAHEAFLRKMQPPFFTMRDSDHTIVAAAGVPAMPTTYIFGRDGRLRTIHRGFHGKETEAELRSEIEALLSEEK